VKALPDTEQAASYKVSEPPTRAKAASRPQVKEPKAAVDLVPDTVVIESEAARAVPYTLPSGILLSNWKEAVG